MTLPTKPVKGDDDLDDTEGMGAVVVPVACAVAFVFALVALVLFVG